MKQKSHMNVAFYIIRIVLELELEYQPWSLFMEPLGGSVS